MTSPCADIAGRLEAGADPYEVAAASTRHLAVCTVCRALVDDLSRIREAARALPELVPPAAVRARVLAATTAVPVAGPRPVPGAPWLAAAAALLLAVGAALGSLATMPAANAGGAAADAVTQVTADLQAAEAHYQRAIAGLEAIARSGDDALDPAVADVLRANLQTLDRAIRETRAALAARPDDELARRGFLDALDGKVALLEQTVSLIDAERDLDPAGPAAPAR
ncbi:MAG: hypothetical protein AB7U83_18605 [Vicinamibacterales bacterium]